MVKPKETLEEYLEKIVDLHTLPLLVLVRIDKERNITIEAIGTNKEAISLVVSEKDLINPQYIG